MADWIPADRPMLNYQELKQLEQGMDAGEYFQLVLGRVEELLRYDASLLATFIRLRGMSLRSAAAVLANSKECSGMTTLLSNTFNGKKLINFRAVQLDRCKKHFFPDNLSLDEFFFGERIPMELPCMDQVFLAEIKKLGDTESMELYAKYKRRGQLEVQPYQRLKDLEEEMHQTDLLDTKRYDQIHCEQLYNYLWRLRRGENQQKSRLSMMLVIAVLAGISTDYLFLPDYGDANLWIADEKGNSLTLTGYEKAQIKWFLPLSLDDKVEVIHEAMAMND